MVRRLSLPALMAGLWLASTAAAAPPSGSPDQQLAVAVATKLGESAMFPGMSVDILCVDGKVELTGNVREVAHKAAVEKAVKSVAGVKGVSNKMSVGTSVVQAQAAGPETLPPPGPVGPGAPGAPAGIPDPQPAPPPAGGPVGYDQVPPKLPSYAWPTYAPYNNYSRVGYPLAYPYNAFPFIGPFYPFPKVPLGWRKVTLEWEDGHWFIGKNASCHDYWRVRFW